MVRKFVNERDGTITDGFAELSGISRENCSSFCNADRCVISNQGTCAHPCKNGLQRPGLQPPEILERYADACKILGVKNKHEVAP
jgi:hypothetical protein